MNIESGSQILRDSHWSPAFPIDVDPVRFRLHQHALAIRSQNQILAQGAALFDFGHPGLERNRLRFEGRSLEGDEVRADDPNCSILQIAFHRPTSRGGVFNRDLLHPRDILQIADVPQFVDRIPGDSERPREKMRRRQWEFRRHG